MSGTLRLRGSTSGYAELQAAAVAGDQTFILPAVGGTLLTTDSPIGNLTLEVGSASQPSLRFEGDTDTGLFSSGANTLNLVTGGSNKLVLGATAHTIYSGTNGSVRALDINSSGNIGIGTVNPTLTDGNGVHIAGSSGALKLQNTTNGNWAYVEYAEESNTTKYIQGYRDSTGLYAIRPGATLSAEIGISLDSSGNIGIGTSAPSYLLDLSNSSNAYLRQTRGSNVFILGPAGDQAADGVLLRTSSNSPIRFDTNGSNERMRIENSGNVNIGRIGAHTDSTARLAVFNSGASESWSVRPGTNVANQIDFISYNYGTSAYLPVRSIASEWSWFDGDAAERMRIDSSGRLIVGINTSPTSGSGQYGKLVSAGNTLDATGDGRIILARGKNVGELSNGNDIGGVYYTDSLGNTFASIKSSVDDVPGADDFPGNLSFNTTPNNDSSPTPRMIIDSAGRALVGTTTYTGNGQVAIAGNSSGSSAAGCLDIRPTLSRPTVADTTLSLIRFGSADHSNNTGYASINVASDGDSASDSDIPGRLEFHTTPDGDSSPTESMRLTASKQLWVNTTTNTHNHNLIVEGSTKTSWFTCDEASKTVNASDTAVLTIDGANPTFVQVYIKVNFAANGGLQAHFDYEILTCDSLSAGGGTTIRTSLNESVGSFQVSTSDFAVTRSNADIIITYTNQNAGQNGIAFYVHGRFHKLSIA